MVAKQLLDFSVAPLAGQIAVPVGRPGDARRADALCSARGAITGHCWICECAFQLAPAAHEPPRGARSSETFDAAGRTRPWEGALGPPWSSLYLSIIMFGRNGWLTVKRALPWGGSGAARRWSRRAIGDSAIRLPKRQQLVAKQAFEARYLALGQMKELISRHVPRCRCKLG